MPIGVDLGQKNAGRFSGFVKPFFVFFGEEKTPKGGILPTTRKVGGFRVTPRTYSMRMTYASRCPLGHNPTPIWAGEISPYTVDGVKDVTVPVFRYRKKPCVRYAR